MQTICFREYCEEKCIVEGPLRQYIARMIRSPKISSAHSGAKRTQSSPLLSLLVPQ